MSVSIVIPVKNEGKHLRACLDGWNSQTIPVEEIVVIDSGSTDNTLEIARSFSNVTVIEIAGCEFNHGATRNQAIKAATGEFVMMTVGDARPTDDKVLEKMLACFTDESVAGVCGLQVVPHDHDKNPVEWFRPQSKPTSQRFQFTEEGEYDELPPDEKHRVTGWDDVVAMYRRRVIQNEIPYREITYGEDIQWAQEAYRAGYALVYCPAARVYHYHFEDAVITFKRTITVSCLRYRMFGELPECPPIAMPVLRTAKALFQERGLSAKKRFRWLKHNIQNQLALRSAVKRFRAAVRQGDNAVQDLQQQYSGKQFKVAENQV